LVLSQSYYVEKILEFYFKGDNSFIKTPMNISVYLSKNRGNRINQLEYSQIFRSLIYVINHTRLDITYSVNKLNSFTSTSSMNHSKAINRYSNILGAPWFMGYTKLVTLQQSKAIEMLIGYRTPRIQNPLVDISSFH
jgi:hypothetical protein